MSNDTIVIDTPGGIALYRILTLKKGLKLEIKGMRLSRGRSCYAILKDQYGFRGSRQSVLDQVQGQLDDLEAEAKAKAS